MSGVCPECGKPTIRRIGGEWCSYCRGFVHEVGLFHLEHGEKRIVRVLRGTAR